MFWGGREHVVPLLNLFEFIAGKAFTDFNKIIHQENLEYLFGLQM